MKKPEITTLCFQEQVMKDDIRCEVCGTIDELCSFVGLAKSLIKKKKLKNILENIQRDLFKIGSEVAIKKKWFKRLRERIKKNSLEYIQINIEEFKNKISLSKKGFIIPGGNLSSCIVDVARAVTRRLERRTVTLKRRKMLENKYILPYLNGLSTLLYFIARYLEGTHRFKD